MLLSQKEYEVHTVKKSKANNANFFIYMKNRKPACKPVGPLDNEGIKGKEKDDMEIAGKLNEFFASVFIIEVGRHLCLNRPFQEGILKN